MKIRKKFLAIKNLSVNETKSGQANKHLFSLTFKKLNAYFFFYYGHLSSAQLDRWQAIIDQTMDINLSLQILGWYVKGTGLG